MGCQKFLWVFSVSVVSILWGCAPQLTGGKTKTEKANGGKVETVGEEQLDITTKDGTSVSIAPGTLAVGSSVTVQPTEQPSEFAAVPASVTAASSPLEFTATDPNGAAISSVATPMTINIPLASVGAELNLLQSNDQLCTLLKATDGSLFVWRRSAITIDEAAAAVIVKTTYFGVYQLVYCGNEDLPGFTDASTGGVTGETTYAITMTVPADLGAYSATRHCYAIVANQTKAAADVQSAQACSAVKGHRCPETEEQVVVAASSSDVTNGLDTVLTMELAESKLDTTASYFLGVTFQSSEIDCPFTAGSKVPNQDLGFDGVIAFNITGEAIAAGINGTLGTGDFALDTVAVEVGAPAGVNAQGSTTADVVCLGVSNSDTGSLTEVNATLSAELLLNGAESINVFVPTSTTVRLQADFGVRCGDTGSLNLDTARPFRASLDGLAPADTIYLVPVALSFTEEFKTIAGTVSADNACIAAWSSAQGTAGQRTQFDVKLSVSSYNVFLPYSPTTGIFSLSGDGQPLYNMSLDVITDNCQTKTAQALLGENSSKSVTDKPLNESIILPE